MYFLHSFLLIVHLQIYCEKQLRLRAEKGFGPRDPTLQPAKPFGPTALNSSITASMVDSSIRNNLEATENNAEDNVDVKESLESNEIGGFPAVDPTPVPASILTSPTYQPTMPSTQNVSSVPLPSPLMSMPPVPIGMMPPPPPGRGPPPPPNFAPPYYPPMPGMMPTMPQHPGMFVMPSGFAPPPPPPPHAMPVPPPPTLHNDAGETSRPPREDIRESETHHRSSNKRARDESRGRERDRESSRKGSDRDTDREREKDRDRDHYHRDRDEDRSSRKKVRNSRSRSNSRRRR